MSGFVINTAAIGVEQSGLKSSIEAQLEAIRARQQRQLTDNDAIMAVINGWTPRVIEKEARRGRIRTGSTVRAKDHTR